MYAGYGIRNSAAWYAARGLPQPDINAETANINPASYRLRSLSSDSEEEEDDTNNYESFKTSPRHKYS